MRETVRRGTAILTHRAVLFALCELANDDGVVVLDGDPARALALHMNREQRRRAKRTKSRVP
jgi:hypothetical protein